MGKVPLDTSAFESVLDPHSGGHDTPEVNRRYANVVASGRPAEASKSGDVRAQTLRSRV